jgi:hypothetical protein
LTSLLEYEVCRVLQRTPLRTTNLSHSLRDDILFTCIHSLSLYMIWPVFYGFRPSLISLRYFLPDRIVVPMFLKLFSISCIESRGCSFQKTDRVKVHTCQVI